MNLFVFGLGYSASHYARTRGARHEIAGTVTSREKADALGRNGIRALVFAPDKLDSGIAARIAGADAVLVSIPPGETGDPVLARFANELGAASNLRTIVYLSTVGVYGDHAGAWVDETSECRPVNARSHERLAAEKAWLDFAAAHGKVAHVLRLSGIYGPGQNALVNLRNGIARRIVKPGQVFNRIHVEDIANAIDACLAWRGDSAVWNVTDDLPAPAQDVVAYAAELMGVEPPPEIDFDAANLSPMARSFYAECKRVSNRAMKRRLGVRLSYPTYRDAFSAMWAASEGR